MRACAAVALICAAAPARARRQQEAAQAITRSVVDEAGRKVAVPLEVRRIVTLAPNLTEVVFALGAGDRLVGVSEFSDYPADAKSKPSIGMPVSPSLEAIVAAKPDVVLATAVNTWETVDSLARLGIAVYTTDPHTVADMLRSITDIGDVIGAREQAHQVVAGLQARLDALKAKLAGAAPVPVFFVVWDHPLISVGEETFIADALRLAGAQSVVRTKQDWPSVSMEEVVKLNPDFIIYADDGMGADLGAGSARLADFHVAVARHLAELRSDGAWRDIPAIRDGHVAVVSEEMDVPAPGLIDVIEQLAQELHPEIFGRTIESQAGSSEQALCIWQKASLEARPCVR